jgi:hypothetical protein
LLEAGRSEGTNARRLESLEPLWIRLRKPDALVKGPDFLHG